MDGRAHDVQELANLLLDQARILDGELPTDPAEFTKASERIDITRPESPQADQPLGSLPNLISECQVIVLSFCVDLLLGIHEIVDQPRELFASQGDLT